MESTDHELNKTNKVWLQPKSKTIWQQQVLSRQSFDHAQLCVVKVKIAKLFHLRADHSTYGLRTRLWLLQELKQICYLKHYITMLSERGFVNKTK